MGRISLPRYVWTLYGLNTLFFGLILYRWNQSEMRRRLRTTGTVIDVVRHASGSEGGVSYSPIFRFVDSRTGEEFEAESYYSPSVGTFRDDDKNWRSSQYPIGKTFDILYKPDNPSDDVRIDSFFGNGSLGCVILAAFGGIVTLVSILAR
jgi:hypothetical protein